MMQETGPDDEGQKGNVVEAELVEEETVPTRSAASIGKPGGITDKQRAFANAVVQGKPILEAYKDAYQTAPQTKKQSIYSNANKLLRNPKVKAYIDAQNERIMGREWRSAAVKRDWIVSRLMHEAEHAESDSTRVRALELLGKMYDVRLFTDQIDVEDNRQSSVDLHLAIADRLERLIGKPRD